MKDFYELTQLKIANPTTGIFMIGGGVPKNFAQDIVVAAEILGDDAPMHKYAVQVTVADVRDGALSSSTLKEASSWGKVDTVYEQMVFSEATLAVPLIAGYAYHKGAWKARKAKRWTRVLEPAAQAVELKSDYRCRRRRLEQHAAQLQQVALDRAGGAEHDLLAPAGTSISPQRISW